MTEKGGKMKAWSVSDKWYELQVAVIAETRSRAKTIAFHSGIDLRNEWTDMRCRQVKSPLLVEGPERELDLPESIQYGFHWDDESMDFYFPDWYEWTVEYRKVKDY